MGDGVPSRSQIEAWDVEHLHAAAAHWTSAAQRWEEHYSAIHAGMLAPGGTTWEGDAAEAAQERSWADLVTVRGLAECLHDASAVARNGAEDITWAKRQTLDSIGEAENNRFAVAEDLSVMPPSASSPLARVPIGEAVAAQEYATQIAARAQTLAAIDQQVASSITSALAPLQGVSFGDDPGDRAPVVQAMGNKYKTDVQDGDHDPYTGADNHKPQPKTPLPPQFDPNTGAAENGGGPLGKVLQHEIEPYEEGAAGAGLDLTTAHARALGMDPATGGFRASEAETGLRVEQQLGVTLTRAGPNQGYDWVDASGKTYDAVGNFPSKFFDAQWPTLQGRIIDHLAKAEIVPVDVSQFTAAQREVVQHFVAGLNNSRVVIVGGR